MGNLLPSHDFEVVEEGEDFCVNVTYEHRVLNIDNWTWCPVPESSYDAVFFAAFAVFTVCVAPPKYATLVCLVGGCLYQVFANYWNLGHVSNSVALWLNMSPADVFVYAFFPPLLLDSAVRMDFFMLRKVIWNVLYLAFIMVLCSALLLIPFMLWALGLEKDGWNAVYVALFGTMIGSTDAASCIAILKAGGAPELLSIVLEGESLFNDASSLTMFEIFKNIVLSTDEGLGKDLEKIAVQTVVAFTGGVGMGLAMAIFVVLLLRWLHWRRLTGVIEIAVSVAGAYMVYYLTQVFVPASGVVAVVTFGLVGSATMLWGMSKKLLQSGEFFAFWDTYVFILNGIIFFYVGASSTNLVLRASEFINANPDEGPVSSLSEFFARMAGYVAAIYAFSFFTRFWFVLKSFKMFEWLGLGVKLSFKEILFVSVAGLRGSLSLILVQTVIKVAPDEVDATSFVRAEIALWTTAYVLLTLVVNAPLLGPLLGWLGLNKISAEAEHIQKQVERMLQQHSEAAISELRANPDELLEGVQWSGVEDRVMLWHAHFQRHAKHSGGGHSDDRPALWRRMALSCTGCWGSCAGWLCFWRKGANGKVEANPPDLARSTSGHISALYLSSHFVSPAASRAEQSSAASAAAAAAAAAGTAGSADVGVSPAGVELAVMTGKPPTPTPSPAAVPAGGKGWDDLEETVEQYIAETQDDESFFGETPPAAGQPASPQGGKQDGGQAVAEIRAMGPSLQDMPLRAPTMPRDAAGAAGLWHLNGSKRLSSIQETTPATTAGQGITAGRSNPAGVDAGADGQVLDACAGDAAEELPLPPGAAPAAVTSVGAVPGVDAPKAGAATPALLPMEGAQTQSQQGSGTALSAVHVQAGAGGLDTDTADAAGPLRSTARTARVGLSSVSMPVRGGLTRPSRVIALRPQGAMSNPQGAGDGGTDQSPHPSRTQDKILLVNSSDPRYGVRQVRLATHQPLASRSTGLGTVAGNRQIHRIAAPDSSGPGLEYVNAEEGNGAADGEVEGKAASLALSKGPGAAAAQEQVEQLLPEFRMRLLTGLRQHFRARYHEGVISMKSFDILNYACNTQLHSGSDKPLALWECAEKEVSRKWTLRAAGRLVFLIRCSVMETKRRQHQGLTNAWYWLYRGMLKGPAWLLSHFLDRSITVGLEVAMELWQALSGSPKTLWLAHSGPAGSALLQEVKQQSDLAWSFVIDRRVEAPEKFQAIQTFRATLALLSQQATFVEELLEDGVIEEKEAEHLEEAVARRRQEVEHDGPVRRRPRLRQILSDSNLMQGVPEEVVRALRAQSQLKIYKKGQAIFENDAKEPWKGGLMLVVSGIVRMVMEVQGNDVSVYLGSGTGVGLLSCVIQAYVPGITPKACYAEGDSLARGPVVLFVPWPVLQDAIQLSRKQGLPAYRAMDLHFMRRAAAMILDAMRGTTSASLAEHIQHLLLHILDDHHQCLEAAGTATVTGVAATAVQAATADGLSAWPVRLQNMATMSGAATAAAAAAAIATATLRRRGSARLASSMVPVTSVTPPTAAAALSGSLMRLCSLLEVLGIPGSAVAEQLLAIDWHLACAVVDDREFVPLELIDLKELLARQVSATVHSIHERLMHQVLEGRLLILAPGQAFLQACTAVLVQGSLVAPGTQGPAGTVPSPPRPSAAAAGNGDTGRGTVEEDQAMHERVARAAVLGGAGGAEGDMAAAVQDAPSLMLWSPDFVPYTVSGELAHPSQVVAGPRGAEVIVLGPHAGALQAL